MQPLRQAMWTMHVMQYIIKNEFKLKSSIECFKVSKKKIAPSAYDNIILNIDTYTRFYHRNYRIYCSVLHVHDLTDGIYIRLILEICVFIFFMIIRLLIFLIYLIKYLQLIISFKLFVYIIFNL